MNDTERRRFHLDATESPQLLSRTAMAPPRLQGAGLQRTTSMQDLPFEQQVQKWQHECEQNLASWEPSWKDVTRRMNGAERHVPTALQHTADILIRAVDPNCRTLEIESRPLPSLPTGITKLANLNSIKIISACLQSLPESIGNMRNLRDLQLSQNPLTALPASLCNLSRLETLNVFNSPKLMALPDNLVSPDATGQMQGLTSLKDLTLGNTGLTSLPASATGLLKLQKLDLSGSPVQSLPSDMHRLKNLLELHLDKAKIELLPPALCDLSQLEQLKLSRCQQLRALPEKLGQLGELEVLDLRGCNNLAALPATIAQLPAGCKITVPSHLQAQLANLRPPDVIEARLATIAASQIQLTSDEINATGVAMLELLSEGKNPFLLGNPSYERESRPGEAARTLGESDAIKRMLWESDIERKRDMLAERAEHGSHDEEWKRLKNANLQGYTETSEANYVNLVKAVQMWEARERAVLFKPENRKAFPVLPIFLPEQPEADSHANP
ncbi:leucine-rich repeat domain-containing protein [Xanthomonas hyacinthi]|uniref:leucine-rich repeat domain-containing protein n=1 Tax=Xanthomonas hyacinthi TaxID=56455 RepID=UPI0011B044F6|nr:leucine-rich repeat domain-containing protein [Xanthomonas hyacinthi]QGY77954.1 leucine-rich repeat domain-containing protein [Xanthomonas hyacinthi]